MAYKDAGVVSATELHAFGSFLKRSEQDIIELINRISTEVIRVNEGWDDKVNQKFTENFGQYISTITRLVELLEEHSQFVHRKASAIENYNNIH